uniref:Uncharacterized protein n=1 Tax=Rhizophora mucronata TaxID=61149 RepID=A0A2P2PUV3_RHIMU
MIFAVWSCGPYCHPDLLKSEPFVENVLWFFDRTAF